MEDDMGGKFFVILSRRNEKSIPLPDDDGHMAIFHKAGDAAAAAREYHGGRFWFQVFELDPVPR
jgi:hypothetical protein